MKKKYERNSLIVDLYYSRWSQAAIARYFKISRQRVNEIIKRETANGHRSPYFNYFTDMAILSHIPPTEVSRMITIGRMFKVNSDKDFLKLIKDIIVDKDTEDYYYNGKRIPRYNFECLENYMISRYEGMNILNEV